MSRERPDMHQRRPQRPSAAGEMNKHRYGVGLGDNPAAEQPQAGKAGGVEGGIGQHQGMSTGAVALALTVKRRGDALRSSRRSIHAEHGLASTDHRSAGRIADLARLRSSRSSLAWPV